MNCFVIMPFATDFDDVYSVIKNTVEGSADSIKGRCFRLDESSPAGRITDRLVAELRSATICIADLTENKPNVLWELGFAMALEKPTIIVTQSVATLPFDIRDMQSIEYTRTHLSTTLIAPLRQSLLDTLGTLSTKKVAPEKLNDITVGSLMHEVSQLKNIVAEAVNAWRPDGPPTERSQRELLPLVGHWFNTDSKSHVYSRVIRGELVSPYCYGGNEVMTGVYFGWRRTGEYWFARYQWLQSKISGFSFLRMDALDVMSGAWWSSDQETAGADFPPQSAGVPAKWIKQTDYATPPWADEFFRKVEHEGLASLLAR
jgi:hypothetical protein